MKRLSLVFSALLISLCSLATNDLKTEMGQDTTHSGKMGKMKHDKMGKMNHGKMGKMNHGKMGKMENGVMMIKYQLPMSDIYTNHSVCIIVKNKTFYYCEAYECSQHLKITKYFI